MDIFICGDKHHPLSLDGATGFATLIKKLRDQPQYKEMYSARKIEYSEVSENNSIMLSRANFGVDVYKITNARMPDISAYLAASSIITLLQFEEVIYTLANNMNVKEVEVELIKSVDDAVGDFNANYLEIINSINQLIVDFFINFNDLFNLLVDI